MMMGRAFRNSLSLLLILVVMTACANNVAITKVGSLTYPPLTLSDSVLVFNADTQVKSPFEVIANIEFSNLGKYRRMELADAIEPIKEAARGIGANGIIIDKTNTIFSGFISRGISVEARAIHHAVIDKPDGAKLTQKERLKQLGEMRDEKMITQQEFELKKKEIIDSL
jgi:hypothetical protein